jgi:hypothetical protein
VAEKSAIRGHSITSNYVVDGPKIAYICPRSG